MGAWIDQMFEADEAKTGGVVRRQVSDVAKYGGGLLALMAEVEARGFHLIEIGDQYIVLCNTGQMKVHR